MYNTWNLDDFYKGCDDETFVSDVERLKKLCADIKDISAKAGSVPDADFVKEYITADEQLYALTEKLLGYLSLRRSVDAGDSESAAHYGRLLSVLSETSGASAAAEKYIGGIEDLDAIIKSDALLSEYRYLITNMQRDGKHMRSKTEEEIMSKYNLSGGNAWEEMRDYVTSAVEVDYGGGKTTLPEIRNLAYDPDASVRKAAYEAEMACYKQVEAPVAFALNSIKLQTISECEIRGYKSPMDKVLSSSRMQQNTLDALLEAMQEFMPAFRRYLRAKAEYLGHKNGLPWYDLFAPVGKCDDTFTPEQAHKYLLNVFGGFDGELTEMIDLAFKEDWIDFFPRAGKQGGAFCAGAHGIKQSRILTNFGGRFGDVMTLAHELGHAFHNKNLESQRDMNIDYSMPVAETASNFNEVVVMDYALAHAESRAKRLALLESKLSDTCQIICDIYSRYLFEKSVFDARKDEFLFPDKLCELMLDAQRQAYGDGLDENCMHKYMWICKSHYYSAGLSYYNWPYAFGGLFAQGLFSKYKQQGAAFVPLYKKLLTATPVCDVEDAARVAGIDVTDAAFWREGLKYFADMIDDFIAQCKASSQH